MPSSIQIIRLYSTQNTLTSVQNSAINSLRLCLLKTEACGWYENGIRCRWQIPAEGDLLNDNFVQSCWSVWCCYWTIYLWKWYIMTALYTFSIVQMAKYSSRRLNVNWSGLLYTVKDPVYCLLGWVSVGAPTPIQANTKESIFVISLTSFKIIEPG